MKYKYMRKHKVTKGYSSKALFRGSYEECLEFVQYLSWEYKIK